MGGGDSFILLFPAALKHFFFKYFLVILLISIFRAPQVYSSTFSEYTNSVVTLAVILHKLVLTAKLLCIAAEMLCFFDLSPFSSSLVLLLVLSPAGQFIQLQALSVSAWSVGAARGSGLPVLPVISSDCSTSFALHCTCSVETVLWFIQSLLEWKFPFW